MLFSKGDGTVIGRRTFWRALESLQVTETQRLSLCLWEEAPQPLVKRHRAELAQRKIPSESTPWMQRRHTVPSGDALPVQGWLIEVTAAKAHTTSRCQLMVHVLGRWLWLPSYNVRENDRKPLKLLSVLFASVRKERCEWLMCNSQELSDSHDRTRSHGEKGEVALAHGGRHRESPAFCTWSLLLVHSVYPSPSELSEWHLISGLLITWQMVRRPIWFTEWPILYGYKLFLMVTVFGGEQKWWKTFKYKSSKPALRWLTQVWFE